MALSGFGTYYCFGNPALAPLTVDELLLTQAQTAAFLAIQWLHIGYLLTARSIHRSAFSFSPFSNRWILLGIALTILTQLLITYLPPLQTIFKTAAVPVAWWPVILLSLLPGFLAIEVEKLIRLTRKSPHRGNP
jgi:magnesium-transporting ATPase (P-type)